MPLPEFSAEECFPVIRQTILDTYKIDSLFMRYPYSNVERLDMGLRRMVWGTYSTSSAVFSLSEEQHDYQIIVMESILGFYNLIVAVTNDKNPDLFGFLPFRTSPVTPPVVDRIMKENGIPAQHAKSLQQVYYNLPVVDLQSLITTLQHLITAFIPAFAGSRVEYVSYTSEQHDVDFDEERVFQFTSDYLEKIASHMKNCCDAIISGDATQATTKMKVLLDFAPSYVGSPMSQQRDSLHDLNAFIAARMLDTQVHPYYIFRQMHDFDLRIRETCPTQELPHLPYEMARKYCLLAKNYTYDSYSYLIRNVVNHIDQHLSSELSLSTLAAEFHKNPSYLSSEFKKEVGETLTTYINKQRILTSLRYFNTTDMSVADVSNAVGYTDFGYFSRLFRKYVGSSPREYKKMLDK